MKSSGCCGKSCLDRLDADTGIPILSLLDPPRSMETSSPLASLQPNHPGPFAQRCREYTVNFPASCSSELSNFNFKDMSMLKPKPDYFSYHPIKGSSPTTSLAADLSQNFHIEQRFDKPFIVFSWTCTNQEPSPALPTPRRTLFNNNHSLHLLHASSKFSQKRKSLHFTH